MEYLVLAVGGWVGSGWTGYPHPDDPDPPFCPVCARVIGAIGAIIYYMVLKNMLGEDGSFFTLSVLGVLGGAATVSLVKGVMNLAGGGKKSA